MMNKKGEAPTFKILNMSMWRLIFLVFMFFAIYQFSHSIVKETIDIDDFRADIFENRVVYSGAITKIDYDTGRIHPDIIDYAKYNDRALDGMFNVTDKTMTAMVELRKGDGEKERIYFNKELYLRWEPLTNFKQYNKITRFRPALIDYGDRIEFGVLRLDVVMYHG